MRFGLLADIHANLHALRTAIETVGRRGVDRWIVAGDLVGYGPNPDECVEVVAGLDAACVAGNHDLIVLGRLSDERCIGLAQRSLRWTRERLGADARAFLEELPLRVDLPDVTVAHGSLDDAQEYTADAAAARRQLEQLARERPDARALVLGHTHRPLAFAADRGAQSVRRAVALGAGPVLINPGAVGQSRELLPRARAGVLDLEAGRAEFIAVRYDTGACRAALRSAGLPPQACHLPPLVARFAR